MVQGPDLDRARDIQRGAARQGRGDPRPGRRGHDAERRQARDVGLHRPPEGRRPRRAGGGCRRGAAPASGRRPGDDLQRSRRAVRSAPPRRGGRPRHPGRPRRAASPVIAAGHRHARQHRNLRVARFTGDHQPHGPPAAGHAQRQHAARHLTGSVRRKRSPPRRRSSNSARNIVPTSPAARAS